MNTTKILGEAVGIQSQGTVDKTETQTKEGLTSALIVGRFKRGRVDKPMTIHQGNIRGQLGYEPTNIDYQAVQDCLDTGVPSVQVLRVGQMVVDVDPEPPHTISCEGATPNVYFYMSSNYPAISIDINGATYSINSEFNPNPDNPLNNDYPHLGGLLDALSEDYPALQVYVQCGGEMYFRNNSVFPYRIRVKALDDTQFGSNDSENPTLSIQDNVVTFCLRSDLM
jgi:hypothetical protein